ncbi:hypothetical protein SCLCIDRAFT_1215840 [Scleroderma citrinum Foug A]|uniref:Uncharacterized protein n=1 Tax=Scleroderma citrinum Foug A TaxID=1036808 RepID=A0A0C3AA23_9AGAM|nr:hypothetical protein SCLCIDRAFT_1215840 [Scleroderma citrinum Foug A]
MDHHGQGPVVSLTSVLAINAKPSPARIMFARRLDGSGYKVVTSCESKDLLLHLSRQRIQWDTSLRDPGTYSSEFACFYVSSPL